MIYVIGAVAMAILFLIAEVEHYKGSAASAVSANVTLAKSIKGATAKCEDVQAKYDEQTKKDLAAQARTKRLSDAAKAAQAKQTPIVANLDVGAKTPHPGTCEQQMGQADAALDLAAKVRNP